MTDAISPLILSTDDGSGGAGRAAFRLHQGLRLMGVPSRMLVRTKVSDDPAVLRAFNLQRGPLRRLTLRFSQAVDRIPLVLTRTHSAGYWSTAWFPTQVPAVVRPLAPDLVHLHWVGGGFLPVGALPRFHVPVIWTLHDEWAFTGGCHYAGDCSHFQSHCGTCPQLTSNRARDLSWWTWREKQRQWNALDFTVVTPSRWLAERAASSVLLRSKHIHVIANGIDTNRYCPLDREKARRILGLPEQDRLILFGAMDPTSDPRKGFHHLQAALHKLRMSWADTDLHLAILGASTPQKPPDMGFPVHYLGRLHDEISLALVYAAADVFVLPSEHENLANTVMEALACGTPCVAFGIGGNADLIEHQRNGYLAEPYQPDDLAQGIRWVLADDERWKWLSARAREKVEIGFALEAIARRYADLYAEVLETHRAQP